MIEVVEHFMWKRLLILLGGLILLVIAPRPIGALVVRWSPNSLMVPNSGIIHWMIGVLVIGAGAVILGGVVLLGVLAVTMIHDWLWVVKSHD
jgi:hypothetical protein